MHKVGCKVAEPRLKLQLCFGCCRQLSRCYEPLRVQLIHTSKPLNTLIGVFATAVCSDQERRNQCGQEVFFLKEKPKAGQKSDGVSSSLLQSEEAGASYNYLSGLEVQEK